MVRKKSCPCKGLIEVDYSDPSLVFWFFGQNVPTKKKLDTSVQDKQNENTVKKTNKVTRVLIEKNLLSFYLRNLNNQY